MGAGGVRKVTSRVARVASNTNRPARHRDVGRGPGVNHASADRFAVARVAPPPVALNERRKERVMLRHRIVQSRYVPDVMVASVVEAERVVVTD
jgi:hypothetical protein